jgi:hypothetical protein
MLVAAAALLVMTGTSYAVSLSDCMHGGGLIGVGHGGGYTYCRGGAYNGQIID